MVASHLFATHFEVDYSSFRNVIDSNLLTESKVACYLPNCSFETGSKLNCLVDHCKKVHDFKDIPCTFSNCNFIAFNQRGYTQHTTSFHSKHRVFTSDKFRCPFPDCRSSFSKENNLEGHVRVHENNLFPCVFCPYRTPNPIELNNHYRRHYKIYEFKCDLCERSFVKAAHLNSHLENFHQMGEVFKCHLCTYAGTRMRLQAHFIDKHKMVSQWNRVTKRFDTFEK